MDSKLHEFDLPLDFGRMRNLLFRDLFDSDIYLVQLVSTRINIASRANAEQRISFLILDLIKVVKLVLAAGLL